MVRSAPICSHKNLQEKYRYGNIVIYECRNCHLIFTPPRQKNRDSPSLYKNYYQNEIPTRFRFGLEYLIKLFRFFRAFRLFTIYPKAKSILDIGSGRGFTLYFLKKYYQYEKTVGTQLAKNAAHYSREELGLEIYERDLLKIKFGRKKFDFVTMWHVLEHVNEPEKYIKKISSLLNKGGKFVIEVPNFNSWTRKFSGRYWLGLDLDYHLSFFTPQILSKLLKKHKFRIVGINTFSLEYSTFLSTQSIVSRITKTDQVFFKWLQTRNHNLSIIPHVLLFILLTPPCFIINILSYYSKWGEVLLIVGEKRNE